MKPIATETARPAAAPNAAKAAEAPPPPPVGASGVSTVDVNQAKPYRAPPTHAELVKSLLEDPELKRIAESGVAGANLFAVQKLVIEHLGAPADAKVTQIIGDTEGREAGNDWVTLRNAGVVVRDADGTIRFADAQRPMTAVHLGDAPGDRGARGFLDVYEMNRLRETTPIVTLLGNRENKVLIHNDLPDLEAMRGPLVEPYQKFLAEQPEGSRSNTLSNRIRFWVDSVGGARGALEFHQQGLSMALDKHARGELNADDLQRMGISPDFPVGDLEAVSKHYVEAWKPGGVYFTHLKNSTFIADDKLTDSDRIYLHGGLTDVNVTRVPGMTNPPKDLREWRQYWLENGGKLLREVEECLNAGQPIKQEFADLINSMWQTTTGENRDMGLSTIYVTPPREGDNWRGPTENVANKLRESVIHTTHQGHKPQGETAQPYAVPGGDGIYWMHDASRSKDAEQVSVAIGKSTALISRVGDELVVTVTTPKVDSPFGRITRDGYVVEGVVVAGPERGKYRLAKYADPSEGKRYEALERYVTESELEALEPQALYGKSDAGAASFVAYWNELLKKAGRTRPEILRKFERTQPLPLAELAGKLPRDGQLVGVHAPSRFGQIARGVADEEMAALTKQAMASIVSAYGDRLVALHGGTHVQRKVDGVDRPAPEAALMDEMVAAGKGTGVGIVPVGADPDWLVGSGPGGRSLAFVSAVGKHNEDWAAPVNEAGALADQTGGVRLFLGGSTGLVEPLDVALKTSREAFAAGKKPALVFVLKSDVAPTGDAKDVNASDQVARMADLPPNFVPFSPRELPTIGATMKRLNARYQAAPLTDAKAGRWRD